MTPEHLAPRIYAAERELDNRPAWEDAGPFPRSVARAAAVAALSALKGPRTGEELFAALHGPMLAFEHLPASRQAEYAAVAATFSAPPEPVGWPERFTSSKAAPVQKAQGYAYVDGWLVCLYEKANGQPVCVATIYGVTAEEAENLARLTAWTIANQRPVGVALLDNSGRPPAGSFYMVAQTISGGEMVSRTIYEDLKRDHAALLAAVDSPGGYREQVDALKSSVQDATDARLCLASHLTPSVRKAIRPGLLEILASTGSVSPAEVDEALDDADKMAALLLRVRAVGEF